MKLCLTIVSMPDAAVISRPERVLAQRKWARQALRHCAELSGAPLSGWEQDANRVPLPNDGWHWSITHTRGMAAAVVARELVGVDIEQIKPRRNKGLFERLACDEEWRRLGDRSWEAFFRIWTAKEATLKANGNGIGYLLDCSLVEVNDESHMTLEFGGKRWCVEHKWFDDHIVSVTCERGQEIVWTVIPDRDVES